MNASATLRSVIGLDNTLPRLGDTTLIMIDFQNTYRSGVMALEGAEPALAAGARLLAAARSAGTPVVHVVNDGGEGTPYDIRAEIGAISPEVAPIEERPSSSSRSPTPSTPPTWRRRCATWAPDPIWSSPGS